MTDKPQTNSDEKADKTVKESVKTGSKKTGRGNWLTDRLKKKKEQQVKDEDPNIYPLF